MSSLVKPTERPLASDGGITVLADDKQDPFEALDDLMAVIEALCPTWPQRELSVSVGQMLL
jgi:hypothetical protein